MESSIKEFELKKKYSSLLKISSSSLPYYFLIFNNLLFGIGVFLLEKSLVNYIFVIFSESLLWFFKNKVQETSSKIKSYPGFPIAFDGDDILYRKISGKEKRFAKSDCKIVMLNFKFSFKREPLFVLKYKARFYFIGPLEQPEAFLKCVSDKKIPLVKQEKRSWLELCLGGSALCFLIFNELIPVSPLGLLGLIVLVISMMIYFYRLMTRYYAKHLLVFKELAAIQRMSSFAFVLSLVFSILALFSYTERDKSLDKLHLVLERMNYEKNSLKKEKLVMEFNSEYQVFKKQYPGDEALSTLSKRFTGHLSREMASEKAH